MSIRVLFLAAAVVAQFIVPRSGASASCSPSPCIASVSGPASDGSTVTLTGIGFGAHADYGGSNGAFLNKAWCTYEVSLECGGWQEDGQNNENTNRVNTSPRGGASQWYYEKTHQGGGNQGSSEVVHSSDFTGIYKTVFWYYEGISQIAMATELGTNACSKFFRRYAADPNTDDTVNFYFGPLWENATNYEDGGPHRWSMYPTAPYHPQNTWRQVEVIEFLGTATSNGTSIFGSQDVLIVRLNNEELIRRGTGFPSNPQPAQGTDANDNQRWVGDPGITQTGGQTKLGSHLCRDGGFPMTPGGGQEMADARVGFDDPWLNYGLQDVRCGPASTYSVNTTFEMQPVEVWASNGTSITIRFNKGALSSGTRYCYVTNSLNQVTPGFPVTVT